LCKAAVEHKNEPEVLEAVEYVLRRWRYRLGDVRLYWLRLHEDPAHNAEKIAVIEKNVDPAELEKWKHDRKTAANKRRAKYSLGGIAAIALLIYLVRRSWKNRRLDSTTQSQSQNTKGHH
jgi:hypothetical protein